MTKLGQAICRQPNRHYIKLYYCLNWARPYIGGPIGIISLHNNNDNDDDNEDDDNNNYTDNDDTNVDDSNNDDDTNNDTNNDDERKFMGGPR